ncbi:hypothetical protein KSC_018080 [Ktedonobacter sp. SOSP1-52]|nr:hypothetical protein KSC_018080 [Ktedonobacter sp. SOSP1-52]
MEDKHACEEFYEAVASHDIDGTTPDAVGKACPDTLGLASGNGQEIRKTMPHLAALQTDEWLLRTLPDHSR